MTPENSGTEFVNDFSQFEISDAVRKSIAELGYTTPSPIQAQALPILLGEPTDFLGLAATGTGKTAAFSIPMLERINPSEYNIQALILCPTRELANQVAGQIELLGKHLPVYTAAIYGGASYPEQIRALKRATVVIGTPGRTIDHIERGTLKLDNIKTLILDEADEMISMGFKEDLETILKAIPRENSQTWLFSATMSRDVRKVADEYLTNPKQVQVNKTEMVPSSIEQLFFRTKESNKPEILCKIIDAAEDFYGLIFCQTKIMVTDLTQYMTERGYKVDCLHGDKDQNARERAMKAFRDKKVNVLICTDVASRGLDVKDVTHVVNYSLPRELDNYVHRIGRTARSGKKGIAMSLVTPSHQRLLGQIERMTKTIIKEGRIPSRKEVGVKKVTNILPKFQGQETFAKAIDLLDETWKTAIAGMSADEVAGRFLTLMFPEIFSEKDAEEIPRRESQDSRSDSRGGDRGGYRGNSSGGDRGGYSRGGDSGGGYRGNSGGGYQGGGDRGGYQGGDRRSSGGGGFAPRSYGPGGSSRPDYRSRDNAAGPGGGAGGGERPYRPRFGGSDSAPRSASGFRREGPADGARGEDSRPPRRFDGGAPAEKREFTPRADTGGGSEAPRRGTGIRRGGPAAGAAVSRGGGSFREERGAFGKPKKFAGAEDSRWEK